MNLVDKAKEEYSKNDLVMSELLRDKEFSELSIANKLDLLKWAGEDEFMTVDTMGNVVCRFVLVEN